MFLNRNIYLFVSLIMSSTSIFTQNHEVGSLVLFLRKLSYTMWHSLFFISKIYGAFLIGNNLYIVQALLLLLLMITVESYTLQRYIKGSYRQIVPPVILINLIAVVIQSAIAYPLFYLIDLHNYAQNLDLKIYSLYGLTISASIIILICRMMIYYVIYGAFDTTTNKDLLKRSIIKINCISYSLIVSIFFIAKFFDCHLI